jgi:predicted TIM-barrel fold metal-dependent hydrolase
MADRQHLEMLTSLPGRAPRFGAALKVDATPPNGGPPASDPKFLAQHHLDRNNIEIGILLPLEPTRVDTWTDPDEAAVVVRGYNDLVASKWLTVDHRFRMAMVVSPHDPQLAAVEIQRFGKTDGVVGVLLPMINRLLGNRYFFPIYEAAIELDLPIILHPNGTPGDYQGTQEFAGGNPPSRLERHSLLTELAMSNVTNLICEGVFERYPKLRFSLSEFAWSWVPSLMWRLDENWKAARSAMPWIKRAPSAYVDDHIRFTSQPALEVPDTYLIEVLRMLNASRTLCFSSDYPHWDGEDPLSVFKHAAPELRQRIFRENAIEFYGERLRVQHAVV